jgi:predicted nucleic acid-binding protein
VIVLDATVLVYAVGADHPLAGPARAIVSSLVEGRTRATTTVEAIQEFVHVRARRRDRSDAAALGRDFATLLAPLLSPDAEDLEAGLVLFESIGALGCFDAVLAATAARRGALALVSADAALVAVPGLRVVSLNDPDLRALIDG